MSNGVPTLRISSYDKNGTFKHKNGTFKHKQYTGPKYTQKRFEKSLKKQREYERKWRAVVKIPPTKAVYHMDMFFLQMGKETQRCSPAGPTWLVRPQGYHLLPMSCAHSLENILTTTWGGDEFGPVGLAMDHHQLKVDVWQTWVEQENMPWGTRKHTKIQCK